MHQDDSNAKSVLPKILQFNIAELLESMRIIENELHDMREVVWTLEEKLREEGISVVERKV